MEFWQAAEGLAFMGVLGVMMSVFIHIVDNSTDKAMGLGKYAIKDNSNQATP